MAIIESMFKLMPHIELAYINEENLKSIRF